MNIDANSGHSGSIEHRVDTRLGVVAHYQTAELQPCTQETARGIVPQFYFRVVILEI